MTSLQSWLVMASPIDPLRIVESDGLITHVQFSPFDDDVLTEGAGENADSEVLQEAARQLSAYFAGELTEFDLPLGAQGTEYQQRVWQALRTIPYGQTSTYAGVAALLGQVAGASRAVGLANGRNPIPVVVPCHRVIGADGSLTGFAGGVERKRLLLELESTDSSDRLF